MKFAAPLIAFVDDEVELIREWADYFSDDFEITVSHDPVEFIEQVKIAERQPDVIVTDLMMPGIRGQDLITTLKANGIKSRFIIVSAYAQKQDVINAINTGVFGVIEKPVKPVDLKKQIDHVIQLIEEEKKSNPILIELCNILNERSEALAKQLIHTENILFAANIPLFKSKEEFLAHNNFYKSDSKYISQIYQFQEKLKK